MTPSEHRASYSTFTSGGKFIVRQERTNGRNLRAVFTSDGKATVSIYTPTAGRWVAHAYGKSGMKMAKEMLAEAEASFA